MRGFLGKLFGRVDAQDARPNRASKPDDAESSASRGAALLESGRLLDACEAFEHAIRREPAVASHKVNLAYALQEAGENERALVWLRAAATQDPQSFDARFMLGSALLERDEASAAVSHLAAAVELRAEFVPSHVAHVRALLEAQRADEAMIAVAASRVLHPRAPDLLLSEGNVHVAAGRHAEALAAFDAGVEIAPRSIGLLVNRSVALAGLRRFDDARDAAERSLAVQRTTAGVAARARALQALELHAAAATAWREAIASEPSNAEFVNQLGVVLYAQGLLAEAVGCYRRATELEPEMPGGYANLGLALLDAGETGAAETMLRRGLAIRGLPTLHDNLGIALQRQSRFDEALSHHRLAIALDPENLDSQCNLASVRAQMGGSHAAMASYRRILALRPDHLVAHSNLLFHMSVDEETSTEAYLEEARRFDVQALQRGVTPYSHRERSSDGPLRLGFVSGDLRAHPVGYFLEGVLRHLDPARFELHAYPTAMHEDSLTASLRPLFRGWRPLKGLGDAEAVQRIRTDGIDVLFDLAGHTGDNRLPVFAARAAPLQVTWLGYFASTGVSAMDWVLADDVCVPPGDDRAFTERIWRLPTTRLCFTPPTEVAAAETVDLPADRNGHATFGCFQRFTKVSDRLLALWKRILDRSPDSRLLLMSPQTATVQGRKDVSDRLSAARFPADRVSLLEPRRRDDYLKTYGDVDVMLDTFPYTGGTTTCEALWMGVPTLVREGRSMIARQGMAMMGAAGLPDWIAQDDDDYVARAVRLAGDRAGLRELRRTLRARVVASPLFDVQRFAREFERAVEGMRAADSDTRSREVP